MSTRVHKKKVLPVFNNEDAERDYWSTYDLARQYDKKNFSKVQFPDLKPTSRSISLRLPNFLFVLLKEKANEAGVPYQSLIKLFIKDGLHKDKK